MKTTDLFIVINDDTLNTMKGKDGKTAKFKTDLDADNEAAGKLESWSVVRINFVHRFISHTV